MACRKLKLNPSAARMPPAGTRFKYGRMPDEKASIN